ncbi:MAG: hypothetical protein U1F68_01960 [Gammaproteobacteria bacterium]
MGYAHPTLVVTPAGALVLGVVDAWLWARAQGAGGEERALGGRLGAALDLAEQIARRDWCMRGRPRRRPAGFVWMRAAPKPCWTWLVLTLATSVEGRLWAGLGEGPWGSGVSAGAAPGRSSAGCARRSIDGRVRAAARAQGAAANPVTVTAIVAQEEQPPEGAQAIEWRLFDNRVVETLELSSRSVGIGAAGVEIFFRGGKPAAKWRRCNWAHWSRLEQAW